MGKKEKFDDSELLNEKADLLYWLIKSIDEKINTFISSKRKEQNLFSEQLQKIQEECGKTPEGHDFLLFKKAVLEIDHDNLKCQKCGKETT